MTLPVNAAIPTCYAGVRFRSRLEARWAAMFDLLSWRWEYEPIDLHGYIPDFIVEHSSWRPPSERRRQRRIVEVKPVLDFEDFDNEFLKIEASGWIGLVTVVGVRLFDDVDDAVTLGATTYVAAGRTPGRRAPWRLLGGTQAAADWREAGNRVQWRAPDGETSR